MSDLRSAPNQVQPSTPPETSDPPGSRNAAEEAQAVHPVIDALQQLNARLDDVEQVLRPFVDHLERSSGGVPDVDEGRWMSETGVSWPADRGASGG